MVSANDLLAHREVEASEMSLKSIQELFLRHTLRGVGAILFVILIGSIYARVTGVIRSSPVPLSFLCLLVWYLIFNEDRVPYWARAAVLIAMGYVVGLIDLFTLGFAGDGRLWLLLVTLAALTLFDHYVGGALIVATLLTVGYTAIAIDQGQSLALDRAYALQIQFGDNWWFSLLLFVAMGGIAVFTLAEFLLAARRQWQRELELAERLRTERKQLDQQVNRRLRALLASTEISSQLSSVLNQEQLAETVVERLQRVFHYDYVQMYLLAEDGKTLRLARGTGPQGGRLSAQGHTLSIHEGLVGQAARSMKYILATDVSKLSSWKANPLLPTTKSELAVPIMLADQLLGVLDIQHHAVNGLDDDDAVLVQSIANQLGVALQNARLYEETQRRGEQSLLVNILGQQMQSMDSIQSVLAQTTQALSELLDGAVVRIQLSSRRQDQDHGVLDSGAGSEV